MSLFSFFVCCKMALHCLSLCIIMLLMWIAQYAVTEILGRSSSTTFLLLVSVEYLRVDACICMDVWKQNHCIIVSVVLSIAILIIFYYQPLVSLTHANFIVVLYHLLYMYYYDILTMQSISELYFEVNNYTDNEAFWQLVQCYLWWIQFVQHIKENKNINTNGIDNHNI